MTERPLGVAVVGHAFMGKAHSNGWRNVNAFYPQTPAVRQQVLVGRDPERTAAAAATLGWAEASTDFDALLIRDDIDIVDLCTPGHLHADLAIAALEAGKHVIVEKPMANTVVEAEKMLAAARAAGVQAMVAFNYRRVPALAWARQLIAEGRIGAVRQVRAAYLQDWLADEAAPMAWRMDKDKAGSGALGDLGSHVIDQMRFLLGDEIADVSARLHTFVTERDGADGRQPVTVDDAAWINATTTGGAVASIEVSRMTTGRKNGLEIEVYGTDGAIRFDLQRLNELQVLEGGAGGFSNVLVTEASHPYVEAWWPPGHILGWDHTFTSEFADFLTAINAGTDVSPSFDDGIAVQRVLAAIEDSAARSSQRVTIEN